MNWHIGQRIVAVRDTPLFKKGDEFTIRGVIYAACRCKDIWLDIGIINRCGCTQCDTCGTSVNTDYSLLISTLFRPLDDLSNHTADSLMEEMDREVRVKETHKGLAHIKHSKHEKDIIHNLWSCRCSLRPNSNHTAKNGVDNGAD